MIENFFRLVVVAFCGVVVFVGPRVWAGDWPQWMGPGRDNRAAGEVIAGAWGAGGPGRVWSVKVGEGFASPVVSEGRVVIFHRVDDMDTIEALDARSGERLWVYEYASRFTRSMVGDRGPRSAPAIEGGRVYTYGAQGMALCLDLESGDVIWSVDTAKRFETAGGYFGRLSSPLVVGEVVLLNVGGKNEHGIVALSLADGKTVWGATDDGASYSSPVLFESGGKTRAAFFTRTGLVVVDPANGDVLATRYFRSAQDASVNAATPIVDAGRIFLTSSYDVGAALMVFTGDGVVTAWANDQSLSSQYATPLLHEGYLYGIHGRVDYASDHLRCVELATGKVMWVEADVHNASILLAGDKLVILTDTGELILAAPSAEKFEVLARATVIGREGRAAPALADGFLYARDQGQLVCLDLRGEGGK